MRTPSIYSVVLILVASLPQASHAACAGSSCTSGNSLLQKKSSTVLKPIKNHYGDAENASSEWWFWEDEADELQPVSADKLKAKMGLIRGSAAQAKLFPHASWYYDYALVPRDIERARYAKEVGQEYVGMFNNKRPLLEVNDQHNQTRNCYLTREPQCTLEELNRAVAYAQTIVEMKWVMGPNEAYQEVEAGGYGSKEHKYIEPRAAAVVWAKLIQPVAERNGLGLVSPTTGVARKKQKWIATFFETCWELKDADPPCDVERIDAISVHESMCTGHWWHSNYDPDGREGRNWFKKMLRDMRKVGGMDWEDLIKHENVWVTETSCNEETKGDDCIDDYPQIAQESCLKITGQYSEGHHGADHGQGSIKTMLEMDNVKRFAWFSTSSDTPIDHPNWNKRLGSRMVEMDGTLLPIGRAFQSLFDGTEGKTDCSITPRQCERAKEDLRHARDMGKGAKACYPESKWDSRCS